MSFPDLLLTKRSRKCLPVVGSLLMFSPVWCHIKNYNREWISGQVGSVARRSVGRVGRGAGKQVGKYVVGRE